MKNWGCFRNKATSLLVAPRELPLLQLDLHMTKLNPPDEHRCFGGCIQKHYTPLRSVLSPNPALHSPPPPISRTFPTWSWKSYNFGILMPEFSRRKDLQREEVSWVRITSSLENLLLISETSVSSNLPWSFNRMYFFWNYLRVLHWSTLTPCLCSAWILSPWIVSGIALLC